MGNLELWIRRKEQADCLVYRQEPHLSNVSRRGNSPTSHRIHLLGRVWLGWIRRQSPFLVALLSDGWHSGLADQELPKDPSSPKSAEVNLSDKQILVIQATGFVMALALLPFLRGWFQWGFSIAFAIHFVGDLFRLHKDGII